MTTIAAFILATVALMVYMTAGEIALRADDTFGEEYVLLRGRYWRLGLLSALLAGAALLVGKSPAAGAGAAGIALFGIVALPLHTSDFLKSTEEHEARNPERSNGHSGDSGQR